MNGGSVVYKEAEAINMAGMNFDKNQEGASI